MQCLTDVTHLKVYMPSVKDVFKTNTSCLSGNDEIQIMTFIRIGTVYVMHIYS